MIHAPSGALRARRFPDRLRLCPGGGLSILLGIVTAPVAEAALFTAVALAALIWDIRTPDPERRMPLREAEHGPHEEAAGAAPRILVIANETHFAVSDVDREMSEARERLRATLSWARRQGFTATGEVGDPKAPFASIEDELRRYGADEVLLATHPEEHRNWLEAGMLERLRAELDIPVTEVVVDAQRHEVRLGS